MTNQSTTALYEWKFKCATWELRLSSLCTSQLLVDTLFIFKICLFYLLQVALIFDNLECIFYATQVDFSIKGAELLFDSEFYANIFIYFCNIIVNNNIYSHLYVLSILISFDGVTNNAIMVSISKNIIGEFVFLLYERGPISFLCHMLVIITGEG